jgi:hypothetical protein
MAPRGTRTKGPKEIRDLIAKHDIEVLGPVAPSEYPKQYKSLFKKVYDIAYGFKFQDYIRQMSPIPAADMKRRVMTLKQAAYDCRRGRMKESAWRFYTEHLVLSRFESEVKW